MDGERRWRVRSVCAMRPERDVLCLSLASSHLIEKRMVVDPRNYTLRRMPCLAGPSRVLETRNMLLAVFFSRRNVRSPQWRYFFQSGRKIRTMCVHCLTSPAVSLSAHVSVAGGSGFFTKGGAAVSKIFQLNSNRALT